MEKKNYSNTFVKVTLNIVALIVLIAVVTQLPTKIADKLFYLKNREREHYGK